MSILSFVIVCFIIEATPGPNMAYLAILSALKGRRAGLAAVFGVALGLLIVGCVAATGVAAMIASSPLSYQVLRWAGVAYLLYLAWEGWQDDTDVTAANINTQEQHGKFFKRGLVINLLNPKAAVFFIAVLPGFITAESALIPQAMALTAIYVMIATGVHGAIVFLAGSAQGYLQDQKRRAFIRKILAAALVLVAMWFAVATEMTR